MCSLIDSNLLSVHVNSVYSVPEAWQVQMAQQFNYTVSLPVPLSKEVRNLFVGLGEIIWNLEWL